MTTFYARLSKTTWADVEIDVEKFCSAYAEDRATFHGSDEEFVIETMYVIGLEEFMYTLDSDGDFGLLIKDSDTDYEVERASYEPRNN